MTNPEGQDLLSLNQVSRELNCSRQKAYLLVRNGDLPGVRIGRRGLWYVTRPDLEDYIQRAYQDAQDFIQDSPYPSGDWHDREGPGK